MIGNSVPHLPDPKIPRWPAHLQLLAAELGVIQDERRHRRLRAEIWVILHGVLLNFCRIHSQSFHFVREDDLQDLATEKSLDLLLRMESGKWDLERRHPLEIVRYLSRVARNGLLNLSTQASRHVHHLDPNPGDTLAEMNMKDEPRIVRETPDLQLERKQFAAALRTCFEALAPRLRRIWFFRVFGNLPSKEIAKHPDVQLKASHVDVLLHRSRGAVSKCMREKGFSSSDMPPGTFTELLRVFGRETEDFRKEVRDDES